MLISSHLAFSQNRLNITGSVRSKVDNMVMPGVTIVEKGTQNGTTTSADGTYTISVSNGATLTFSFVGMQIKEVPVGNASTVDVVLEDDLQNLNEVVVTGYKEERKADLTGAVAVVKVSDIKDMPAAERNAEFAGTGSGGVHPDGWQSGGRCQCTNSGRGHTRWRNRTAVCNRRGAYNGRVANAQPKRY